jgi:hypothetical protein
MGLAEDIQMVGSWNSNSICYNYRLGMMSHRRRRLSYTKRRIGSS